MTFSPSDRERRAPSLRLLGYLRALAERRPNSQRVGPFVATFDDSDDNLFFNYAIPDDEAPSRSRAEDRRFDGAVSGAKPQAAAGVYERCRARTGGRPDRRRLQHRGRACRDPSCCARRTWACTTSARRASTSSRRPMRGISPPPSARKPRPSAKCVFARPRRLQARDRLARRDHRRARATWRAKRDRRRRHGHATGSTAFSGDRRDRRARGLPPAAARPARSPRC